MIWESEVHKTDSHSNTIRKFYKDKKRVDKDWQGQKVELEGNVDFVDGTKEATLTNFFWWEYRYCVKSWL